MDFTPIAEVGEFGLIDRLADTLGTPEAPALVQGIGDDAAVYRVGNGQVHVVTTDALIEGVHFDRTFMPMRYLGFKALAVNVSDIAAMNAQPRYATVALGAPNNVSVEQIEALYLGLRDAASRYGLAIIGGDITASQGLTLGITVIGEADEDAVVYRSGAQPGDLLCVTGDLGSAYAGLKVLLDEKGAFVDPDGPQPDLSEFAYVVQRQLYPQARLDAVRAWADAGVRPTALIDLSDGLASEVHHLAKASGVGMAVEVGLLPMHAQTVRVAERFDEAPDACALYGGEDYELLFTLPEAEAAKLDANTFAVLGRVTAPEYGVVVQLPDGGTMPLAASGFRHF
ncbi:MAG: thiamine-phosphate kinase [Bacteroidota bacterium]